MNELERHLKDCPLVAILRGIRPEEAIAVGEALFAAGFRILEVPLNSLSPLQSIRRLADAFAGRALVGAGTVLNLAAMEAVAQSGGELIVMPHADPHIVRAAKERGLMAMPGFATPTEAFAVIDAGADALKLFPAEGASPAVLKALRAVLPPDIPVLPVGGINAANMAPWVAAGAAGFGLGSSLYQPGLTAAEVGQRGRDLIAAARAAGLATRQP